MAFLFSIAMQYWSMSDRFPDVLGPSEFSATYPTIITPAGYAFSIWFLIYVFALMNSVYQITDDGGSSEFSVQSAYFPAITFVLEGIWAFASGLQYIFISSALLFASATLLIVATYRMGRARRDFAPELYEEFFVFWPIGVHAGWIFSASQISVQILATSWGAGPDMLFVLAFLQAAGIVATAYFALQWNRDFAFCWVLLWALTAILQKDDDRTMILGEARANTLEWVLVGTWLAVFSMHTVFLGLECCCTSECGTDCCGRECCGAVSFAARMQGTADHDSTLVKLSPREVVTSPPYHALSFEASAAPSAPMAVRGTVV
ncbi:unnamed protein product [Chrysoparadoxa australica]